MSKKRCLICCVSTAAVLISLIASVFFLLPPNYSPGKPVTNLLLTGLDGKRYKVSDYKGKIVVLEWYGDYCLHDWLPYQDGIISDLQKKVLGAGGAWFTIAAGKPNPSNKTAEPFPDHTRLKTKSQPTAFVVDARNSIGRRFKVSGSPVIAIIAPDSTLAYLGMIDSYLLGGGYPNTDHYALDVIEQILTKETVKIQKTVAKGCAFKL